MQQTHVPLAADPLDRPRPLTAASRRYIVFWLVLAGVAIAYITALTARPDLVAAYLPDLRSDRSEAALGSQGVDIATMRATISQLNEELAEVKTAKAASDARLGMLATRIAELESAAAATAPVAAAAPQPATEGPASALARKFAETKPAAEAKPAAAPTVLPTVVAKAPVAAAPQATTEAIAAQQIETGSIAATRAAAPSATPAAPVSFGPAIVKPAAQPFGLQLGRASTPDALRITWGLITEQNAATLKGLAPHYAAASDAADASLNLIAGPIKSKAEAVKVCNALQTKGINCKVAPFAGEAL